MSCPNAQSKSRCVAFDILGYLLSQYFMIAEGIAQWVFVALDQEFVGMTFSHSSAVKCPEFTKYLVHHGRPGYRILPRAFLLVRASRSRAPPPHPAADAIGFHNFIRSLQEVYSEQKSLLG